MNARRVVLGVAFVLASALAAAGSGPADAGRVTLGPVVRVETPGVSPCPAESETDVVVTKAGTWVGYNDLHQCVLTSYPNRLERLTSLQLLPAGGGPARYVAIRPADDDEFLAGDPALAPDPRGDGVYLATLYQGYASTPLQVYRVSATGAVTRLPSPSRANALADKELLASDTSRRSRFFGRLYLVWDDYVSGLVTLRAFDGRRWLPPVGVAESPGHPDVAVAPNGDVAVVYQQSHGVEVRVSRDGGRTFARPTTALRGGLPGRLDPLCLGRPVVGTRQRAIRGARAAYDPAGRLHVTAALGDIDETQVVDPPNTGAGSGGASRVMHAVTGDGTRWRTTEIGRADTVRFHAALAVTPAGDVAVAWLQVADDRETTYDAYLAVAARGTTAFSPPVRLSTAAALFPSAMEAMATSDCYGIGDYIGLAATARGVVAAWPTTDDTTLPQVDSDVLVREAYLR